MNAIATGSDHEFTGNQPPPLPLGRLADAEHAGNATPVFFIRPASGRHSGKQRGDRGQQNPNRSRRTRDTRDETKATQSQQDEAEQSGNHGGVECGFAEQRTERRNGFFKGLGFAPQGPVTRHYNVRLYWDDWIEIAASGLFAFALVMWVL